MYHLAKDRELNTSTMASVARMMADRTLIELFSPKEREEESPPREVLGQAVGGSVGAPPEAAGGRVGEQLGGWVGDAVGSRVGRREGAREGWPVGEGVREMLGFLVGE